MTETLLEVRDLTVEYLAKGGTVRAADGVSFSLQAGEVVGLAGESGSGKSTVAHALLRVLRPPAVIRGGQVLYRGQDVLAMDGGALQRFRGGAISLVLQSAMNALNPVLTVGEQIVDTMQAHTSVKRKEALARAVEVLKLVGMDVHCLRCYPHQLSGGMRQRAVIAIALALNPPLVILDEPTTALDVVVQKEIMQEIEDLQVKMGLSILFITHDLSLLVEFATRIAVMYAGEIVELAPSQELFAHPLHPYTHGLMGSFPAITGERRRLTGIPGSPPDLRHLPRGCRFQPRCSQALPVCCEKHPSTRIVSAGRAVACHLYE